MPSPFPIFITLVPLTNGKPDMQLLPLTLLDLLFREDSLNIKLHIFLKIKNTKHNKANKTEILTAYKPFYNKIRREGSNSVVNLQRMSRVLGL